MTTATPETEIAIPDSTLPYPTADDIIAAFRKHGITPKPGQPYRGWLPEMATPPAACALGAYAFDRWGKEARLDTDIGDVPIYRLINQSLPNGRQWLIGVMTGFDFLLSLTDPGDVRYANMSAARREGMMTGRAVRRWAFGEDA